MRVDEIERDVLLFRGDAFESVATAFASNGDVLLVDALASRADAEWMRDDLERRWGKTVRTVVVTHYMNDHMAALRLFPKAQIVAHRYFMHTFLSQRGRSAQDDEDFVAPTTLLGDALSLSWGRHRLELFHNPGKTLCTVCIDVPGCDLVFSSDNVVGNIVYLSSGAPEVIEGAIERLQRLHRSRVVPGHIGILPGEALANARHYLRQLRRHVKRAFSGPGSAEAVSAIAIEDCIAPGVTPLPFEREWHARNLEVVLERRLFTLDASLGAAP